MKKEYIYVGIGLLILLFVNSIVSSILSIFKKSDITISEDKAELDLQSKNYSVPIDILEGKNHLPMIRLVSISKLADDLRESMTGLGTDEGALFRVINSLESQTEFRVIAGIYNDRYISNLTTDLVDELSAKEIKIINDKIKQLPI